MKRKLDEPLSSPISSIRANEIIDLVFVKDDIKDVFLTNPTYTHQLFPNETINFLSQPSQARLKIYVMCSDLTQSVVFNQYVSEDDQNRIKIQLEPALPVDFQNLTSDNQVKVKRSNTQPCGKCVHSFEVNNDTFEVWLTKHSDSKSSLTLQRAEKLALWFIESADSIDFSDDRWEALFLYQVKKDESSHKSYFFGGYFTLFTFRNPIMGAKLRVCQALIFPHLQGKGIGKQLLQVVYNLASTRKDTTEVTVEDPAPAFQRLRDRVDFHWAADTLKGDTIPLTKDAVTKLAKDLKFTIAQAYFVAEILTFHKLLSEVCEKYPQNSADDCLVTLEESAEFRKFRLDVKRRILNDRGDLKERTVTKERKQKVLEELFDVEYKRYCLAIK